MLCFLLVIVFGFYFYIVILCLYIIIEFDIFIVKEIFYILFLRIRGGRLEWNNFWNDFVRGKFIIVDDLNFLFDKSLGGNIF